MTNSRPAKRRWLPCKKLAGLLLSLIAANLLGGCTASPQADNAVARAQVSLVAYQDNVRRITEELISQLVQTGQRDIDARHDRAMRAEIKPDGTANAANVEALLRIRLQNYQTLARRADEARAALLAAEVDASNAAAYLGGLRGFFAERVDAAQVSDRALDTFSKLFEEYLSKKEPQ